MGNSISKNVKKIFMKTLQEEAEIYAELKSSAEVFKKAHAEDFINGSNWQKEKSKVLIEALEKIIEMNYQHAEDEFGDRTKAEKWACVTVAKEALKLAES